MNGTGRDPWLRLATVLALSLPLVVLHRTFLRPATSLVAARPDANPLDDPTTNATAMARAWSRFDRGDFRSRDDRVFAPAPNAIALGEWYPLPSLIGYPFARLSGSVPAGVNVSYYLALALAPVAFYVFFAMVAGPGPGPLLAALLVAWGPARMNSLGVLSMLTAGFIVLAAARAVSFLRAGRPRDLALFAALLLAQALAGLYPLAQGGLWCLFAIPLGAGRDTLRFGRLGGLACAGVIAMAPAAYWYRPYFSLRQDFGVVTDTNTFAAHSADLMSLFHGGIYGGPVRDLLERAVPGFPLGAAAFFPTLSFCAALAAWAYGRRRRPEDARVRSPLPWVLLALAFFLLALGPTVTMLGRPVCPGPFSFVSRLPILSSVRGIHRYDQWFALSLGAAAALAFESLRRRFPGRTLPAAACALVALDVWPADVPSYRFPQATPVAAALGDLGPDAIVAYYPLGRDQATRAWVDQLAHGRRVMNGWFSFAPWPHQWAEATQASVDGVIALAMLRDFGAEVVVVDPTRLDPARRAGLAALRAPDAGLGLRSVKRVGDSVLYRFGPRSPNVLSAASLDGLVFREREARLGGSTGSLVLFFGPRSMDVDVDTPAGIQRNTLLIPPVQPSPFRVYLSRPVPGRGKVRRGSDGRLIGRTEGPGARLAAPADPGPV